MMSHAPDEAMRPAVSTSKGYFVPLGCLPRLRLLRKALWFVALMVAPPALHAWDRGDLAGYHERRAILVGRTGGDGVIVLYGYDDHDVAASVTTFRQNEEFYYLTGWNEPGAMLMLVPKEAGANESSVLGREILYLPPRDFIGEKWNGPRLGPDSPEAPAETGFADVRSTKTLKSDLREALKKFPKIYTELTPQPESGEDCFQQDEVAKIRQLARAATLADLRPLLISMRAVKSPGEIALIRKAVGNSVDAQIAAIKAVHPGVWEYEIASLMKYEFERHGSEWPSYPPIVGSGLYSTVLHYDADSRQMESGDLVVMDVAGSYSGYASDMTRTLPVNGHFTSRQREIYEIVRGAQAAVIAAAKPGVTFGGKDGLQRIAYDYINTHGKDLHGKSLGRYFPHQVGHSVGLNVHDPMDETKPFEPGMIITDEPGIYIPEEKIGVRIEDMLLITPDGNEVLTKRLPGDPDEIERMMAGK
jgi:Xaa-Pro aminopeptidase